MKFTRSTPPASAEKLGAEADQRRQNIVAMTTERTELNAMVAEMVGDPAHAQVEARIAELDALIPVEERILARIQAAIPAAKKREETERLQAERAELDRKTEKRCRTLPARYTAAAQAFADVLHEMQKDHDDWHRLNHRLHELGLPNGRPAEHRLRQEFGGTAARITGTVSLVMYAFIPAWDGKTLFRGRFHDWPNQ